MAGVCFATTFQVYSLSRKILDGVQCLYKYLVVGVVLALSFSIGSVLKCLVIQTSSISIKIRKSLWLFVLLKLQVVKRI